MTAFRNVLQEHTRERVPLAWAGTQNDLGSALGILGAREAGTARLEEAVAAYRDALQERTRERVPHKWAESQRGLAISLVILARRQKRRVRRIGAKQGRRN